ncbi:MAG: trifunctional serine/threonine-protein kinase/ATP-binding protein/sensor histidine kinase [Ardenticatenaceae bacterium]
MDLSRFDMRESPKLIFEGANSLIYYQEETEGAPSALGAPSVPSDAQGPVIVKILREEQPTSRQIVNFNNEYHFTKDLTIKGIRKAYKQLKIADKYALLFEYVEGDTVKKAFVENKRGLSDFLRVASTIAQTLGDIHRHDIIHKDINSNNIIVHFEDEAALPSQDVSVLKGVKIIDFGISSRINVKMQHLGHPQILEGTLPYISPEQTGRMNRVVDYRTDLYSLGVTFYEMLTGKLPFESQDALELVHCHIAKRPRPVCEVQPNIPQVLSDIVMKLMAKNAEERYQSAIGLQYDLEKCLRGWEERGKIEWFELGKEDFSGKFQIPQKLYGREEQLEVLNAAFERVTEGYTQAGELMLVAGYSGIGKSALVQELYKPITQQRGYFISGKFDQFQRNIPYSAVVKAFQELVRQLLTESETLLAEWRKKLLAAFGQNGQILIEVIPEIELIVGPQPEVSALGPTEAQNRFNLLFQNFMQVVCQPEHPLVIFLDDLQWADSASLKLIELMMSDQKTNYLFLIGAYRDNEVSLSHPLIITLDRLREQGAVINQITLSPLSLEHTTDLIADTLYQERASITPLAELVMEKTEGNPFFVNEFLDSLYEEGLLTFDVTDRRWQWEMAAIRAMQITDNVVELMIGKLRKLPDETQQVLRLAACVGNRFDLHTIAIIHKKSKRETFDALMIAVQEGLIFPMSALEVDLASESEDSNTQNLSKDAAQAAVDSSLVIRFFKFSHDRVQQAAYALIDEEQKKTVHLSIGRLLLTNTPSEERTDRIFELVDHLNQGADLVTTQTETNEIIKLNLTAGKKAKAAMAYEPALKYLRMGLNIPSVEFLLQDRWQSDYELTLALSLELLEVEYLNANLHEAQRLSFQIQQQAKGLLEKVKVYEFQIQFYVFQNQHQAAIETAVEVLEMLGVSLPTKNDELILVAEKLHKELTVKITQISDLANLPVMTDPYQLAAMRILMKMISAAFQTNPALLSAIVFTMVKLCLDSGNSPLAAYAYGMYGFLSCAFYSNLDSGYQFGQLSLTVLEQFQKRERLNAHEFQAKIECMYNVFVRHWKEHASKTINPLQQAIQTGLETGDVEYAFHNALQYGFHLFFVGEHLEKVKQKQVQYLDMMDKFDMHFHSTQVHIREQMISNLLSTERRISQSADPCLLVGPKIDESKMLPIWIEQNRMLFVFLTANSKTILFYLFKRYDEAIQAAQLAEKYEESAPGMVCIPEYQFYYSLALLAQYEQADAPTKKHSLEKVATNQEKMKFWAFHAPMNYQHKYDLVEAEKVRILENPLEAMRLYDQAIQGAKKHRYIQDEALACERAAEFYLALGREEIARLYMKKAHYGYKMWGANAKVKELEKSFPHLLTRLGSDRARSSGEGVRGSKLHTISTQMATSSTATGTTSTDALDLTTVLKASQAISGEIDLDKLLTKLIKIVIENAGAQRGYLILARQDQLLIQAKGTVDQDEVEVLQAVPIEMVGNQSAMPLISTAMVNLVVRTGESIVLGNAANEGPFTTDPVIAKQQTKSLLCMPLINQGQTSGILYLENNLSTNAFTPDRLALLRVLSSQLAMSLKNAVLYDDLQQHRDHLEDLVTERTAKLTQTLEHLKATQEQLIESEKMAALGALVAGVAHEINTPVGIGITAASTLESETQLFVNACRTGLKRSALKTYVHTAIQSSQLILNNLKRAAKLVHSFKQVAVDQTSLEKRTFPVKSYLESTLRSLQPQLKQTKHILEVHENYEAHEGQEVRMHSYPGAFSQVITNLVMNSMTHAYKKGGDGLGYPERGYLRFQLSLQENRLILEYSDDGCGIPPENLSRIFEPFFTTARNQGGTGLGLHIVYNLVTQKLGGTIRCESQVGVGTKFIIDFPLEHKK